MKSPPIRPASEVVSLLSHILLTPLSGIVLWCEMLRAKNDLPEMVERGLLAIDASARAQVALLDNLVELSHAQAGSTELDLSQVDLVQCIRDVVARNASAASQRHIDIRLTLPSAVCTIEGDAVRIRIALFNVIDNAVHASPRGGHLDVALETTLGGVAIRVADEGDGIAEDRLPDLFTLRDLTAAARAGERRGLGLGLPIARRIVELHGGSIALAKAAPRGCSVMLTFASLTSEPARPPS